MITVISPAKINLLLKISGKREDGYHEIDTIMQEIDLADKLTFQLNKNGKINLTMSGIKVPGQLEDNLILKAAKLFGENYSNIDKEIGVDIHLHKNIPCGSGMGGGSSNAVSTLKGLNQLFNLPFTLIQLVEMAASLGSDTVFFLYGGRCHCSGRGEKVNPLDNNELSQVTLYIPNLSISTAAVFKNFVIETPSKNEKFQFNDLEKAAFKVSSELADIKNILLESTEAEWYMTGSGSTFFTLSDTIDANRIAELKSKLPGQLIQTTFQYKGCYVSNN